MPDLADPNGTDSEVLKLATFEDNFDIQDFISSLSDKLISDSIKDPGPLDPLPFLRTFSDAVDSLLDIRKQVQAKTDKLEGEVKKAEKDYGKRLAELDKGFEAVGTSFSTLESRITSVGRTAIRIGETLETLHVTRNRAQSSSVLLSYYLSLSRGDTAPLDRMLKDSHREGREGREGRMRLAVVLRRLVGLVKEEDREGGEVAGDDKDSSGLAATRKRIEGFCEVFEKEVLSIFDRYYRKGDPKVMAHAARVLIEFNGGTNCIQSYVNQHTFFISKERLLEQDRIGEGQEWKLLPDPLQPPPQNEPVLASLYEEIRTTVQEEAQIIQAVFPNPSAVMEVFLRRVFAQSVQQTIEALFEKANTLSSLSTLRILYLSHVLTASLVDDLKIYDFSPAISLDRHTSSSTAAISDSLTVLGGARAPLSSNAGSVSLVAATLDSSMEELFSPYLEGSRYLERESKSLGELYTTFLHRFTRYHETVTKAKPSSMFNRITNQLASAASTQSPSQGAASAILKYVDPTKVKPPGVEDDKEPPPTAEDGLLKLATGERMLRWHAEAVGRCVELSLPGDVPKNAFALMRVLSEAYGRSFVEVALDSALSKLEAHDAKTEPDLTVLAIIKTTDLACHLWQRYATTALLPLASSSVSLRREMATFHSQSVARVEGKVDAIVSRLLDSILGWLSLCLTKQKKLDFKPKNDDISFERVNTEPCLACVDALDRVRDATRESLSGRNAEGFLTEVGVGFHNLLLDHFKRFPVSVTGALLLTKDLAMYQDAMSSYALPVLTERFAMLRQLGNLFVVQPEVLKTFMRESHLGKIETPLLRPYLQQRSDYSSFAKRFTEEEGFGVDVDVGQRVVAGPPLPGGGGDGGIGGGVVGMAGRLGSKGLSRLGGLMRELESFSDAQGSRPMSRYGAMMDGGAGGGGGGGTRPSSRAGGTDTRPGTPVAARDRTTTSGSAASVATTGTTAGGSSAPQPARHYPVGGWGFGG